MQLQVTASISALTCAGVFVPKSEVETFIFWVTPLTVTEHPVVYRVVVGWLALAQPIM